MTSEADPIVDAWYHYPAKAQKFRVTALDERTTTVEIQYFDGDIDELAALVPKPRVNLTRFHGVFSLHSLIVYVSCGSTVLIRGDLIGRI